MVKVRMAQERKTACAFFIKQKLSYNQKVYSLFKEHSKKKFASGFFSVWKIKDYVFTFKL